MSLQLADLSGKNDPRCTVGSKARRKSLPRLLMTLLTSIPHGGLYFSPSLSHSMFLYFCLYLSLPHLISCVCATHYKNVFQLKMWCWPALSFLLLAVPYNYTGSVSRQIEWASLSLWLCAVLTDRWASQLIPSLVFVELWNACCWWTRPSAAFLFARSRLCPAWGRLVDPRLFKVIRVTVHKINRLLLLPLLLRLQPPYSSVQSFPVPLNGKNIG